MLFIVLNGKALLENYYFYTVVNLGSSVRGALSAAVYRKTLKLSPSGRQTYTTGEIVNYMQIDTSRLETVAGTIHTVWDGLYQIAGYTSLLLFFLGPSVFAGILCLLVIIPLNSFFLKRLSAFRAENLKHTDSRVKLTNEIFQGIRAIKSYNWELPFISQLASIRELEIRSMRAASNSRAILVSILSAAPSVVAACTLTVYALLGNKLYPTKVFTALALFNQLRFPIIFFPLLLNTLADGKVSLKRISKFLFSPEIENYVDKSSRDDDKLAVSINSGQFSWNAPSSVADDRNKLTNVNLEIPRGHLTAIIGPVGSGKTMLLSALLGELNKTNGSGKIHSVSKRARVTHFMLKCLSEGMWRTSLRMHGFQMIP